MRFLLHAAAATSKPHSALASGATKTATKQSAAIVSQNTSRVTSACSPATFKRSNTNKEQSTSTKLQKSWGQQCSPNCGCVVRFESIIDPATDTIVSATYHARAVLTATNADGTLTPRLTQRVTNNATAGTGATTTAANNSGGRPMLTECNCPTVHSLSSRIATHLPGKSIHQVYNSTEFASVRSSPSFRRTVLVSNGLSRKSTKCYDLVEEAFLASVRGHMPRPRREPEYRYDDERIGILETTTSEEQDDDNYNWNDDMMYRAPTEPSRGLDLNPQRYADAARRAGRSFPPPAVDGGDHSDETYMPAYDPRNRPIFGAAAASAGAPTSASSSSIGNASMPAFHLSEDYAHQNGLIGRYDDELDKLCREIVNGQDAGGIDNVGGDEEAMNDDYRGENGGVLPDWLAYVDETHATNS